jgi:ribonuclease HII
MPWIIGIDEAGYGPNLGPFVMSAVACRVPAELAAANLWQALGPAVRRHGERGPDRLLIDDSKLVHSGARALRNLEAALWSALHPEAAPLTVTDFINRFCHKYHDDLAAEPWYAGATGLPLQAAAAEWQAVAERFRAACGERGVSFAFARSVIVCPRRFNELLDRHDSKAAVLAVALAELLLAAQPACPEEPLFIYVDKHGGRNNYAAQLRPAFADGILMADEEGAERSVYRLHGARRAVQVTFQPRADGDHLCVALASMLSKYLREVLMEQFNRFWQQHVPGLKATAGYPTDALRFFADIREAVGRLGIAEGHLWRRK